MSRLKKLKIEAVNEANKRLLGEGTVTEVEANTIGEVCRKLADKVTPEQYKEWQEANPNTISLHTLCGYDAKGNGSYISSTAKANLPEVTGISDNAEKRKDDIKQFKARQLKKV